MRAHDAIVVLARVEMTARTIALLAFASTVALANVAPRGHGAPAPSRPTAKAPRPSGGGDRLRGATGAFQV